MASQRVLAGALVALALLASTQRALARDPAAAEALFRAAKDAMARGALDEACDKFRQSQALDPAPGTLFRLADCEETRGRIATAWALFDEVVQKLEPSDERIAMVRERRARIEPRLPRLVLRVAPGSPSDVSVRRGDAAVGAAGLGVALPIDPGKHVLVVTAAGHAAVEVPIEIAERQTKEVTVQPGPVVAAPRRADAAVGANDTAGAARGSPQRWLGIAVGAVGVVGIGVGTGFGLVAMGKHDDAAARCPEPDPCGDRAAAQAWSDATTAGTVSTVAFVAGGVLAAGGAALWLTAPSSATRVGVGAGQLRARVSF